MGCRVGLPLVWNTTQGQHEYFKQQADDLNETYHQKVNERSTNGEKRFKNTAKRLPGMGVGKATTPAMMVDPARGQL